MAKQDPSFLLSKSHFVMTNFVIAIFLVRLSGVENYNLIHVYIEKLKKTANKSKQIPLGKLSRLTEIELALPI